MPDLKVTCGIDGYQRIYSKLGTFLNHVSGIHGDVCRRTTGTIPTTDEDEVLIKNSEEFKGNERNASNTDSSLYDSTEYV